jgi:NADH:ubiquinone oxidoreductase subunit 6 (subunit J)
MPILELAVKIGAYAMMGGILIFALGVVTLRNLFHCALCLAATMIGIAAVYVVLQAEFLAAVQILLYVGAVVTLVIFAIMLTEHLGGKPVRQTNSQSPVALAGLLGFAILIGTLIVKTPWPVTPTALKAKVSVMGLGKALMGQYVFPFEVISVVLIAALIGILVIAHQDTPEKP